MLSTAIHNQITQFAHQDFAQALYAHLAEQNFKGILRAEKVAQWQGEYGFSLEELGLMLLPVASCYATPQISHFHVGAVVRGTSGNLYFGANHEFQHTHIAQTIHAEQSAISFAWINGEKGLSDIFVNYSPCGHCRQFIKELNCGTKLNIHLPNQAVQQLSHYLPYAFGPEDLAIQNLLLDEENHHLHIEDQSPLAQKALHSANFSHAPYSNCYCGVAIELINGEMVQGAYAENAAFNPSLPALQVALNALFMQGKKLTHIKEIIMVEKPTNLTYQPSAQNFLNHLGIEFRYIEAQ